MFIKVTPATNNYEVITDREPYILNLSLVETVSTYNRELKFTELWYHDSSSVRVQEDIESLLRMGKLNHNYVDATGGDN